MNKSFLSWLETVISRASLARLTRVNTFFTKHADRAFEPVWSALDYSVVCVACFLSVYLHSNVNCLLFAYFDGFAALSGPAGSRNALFD